MAKSLILLTAIGGAGLSWMCVPTPEAGGSPANPTQATRSQNKSVPALYADNCVHCHGAKAEGGGGGTRSLITRDKFDQKWDRLFFNTIKNGSKSMGMDAFGQSMSEPEIWGLVVYIRELQYKGLREAEPNLKSVGGPFKSKRQDYRIEDVATSGFRMMLLRRG